MPGRFRLAAVCLVSAAFAAPQASADAVTDALERALQTYRTGDVNGARRQLDDAVALLSERKAADLAALLPAAPAGWTREDIAADGPGVAIAVFGGGTAAAAEYRRGSDSAALTLVADAPMVGAVATMISSVSTLTGATPRRIGGVPFMELDGQLRGVAGDRMLVAVTGSASVDDKASLIESLDFEALRRF